MKLKLWYLVIMVVFFFSCVTVNIYFPVAAVEKTAEEIVKEVREQQPETEEEESKPAEPETSHSNWNLVKVAYAQEGALEVSNASIRALKASIKARYPVLIPYLKKGIVGENQSGFLEIRTWKGLSLPEKAKVKRLLDAENKDRMGLYKEVAKALQISQNQLERLQKIFAKEWQKTVPSGTWIQKEDGTWVKK